MPRPVYHQRLKPNNIKDMVSCVSGCGARENAARLCTWWDIYACKFLGKDYWQLISASRKVSGAKRAPRPGQWMAE